MFDIKWMIASCTHFAVAAVVLKLLGLILPTCVTSCYSSIAYLLLYIYLARFPFEIPKKWLLNTRIPPENKAVFITGCGSGFGYHLAKRLDSNGYLVFAGCHNVNCIGAKELKRNCSKRLQIIEVEVTEDESVDKAASFVKENLGTSELWSIVNNAGTQNGFEVELTSMEEFRETMEVNAFGPVRVTKAFLPLLRQSRGRVINVTSLGGRLALPYATPYTMSKYAAVAFSECLQLELDVWGIRVISIEPEFFKTALTNSELLKIKMNMTCSNLKKEIREDYGEKYIKDVKTVADFVGNFSSDNIDAVVNALDDAISLRYPNSVYKPCRNFFFKVLFHMAERVPLVVVQMIMKIILIFRGFPKPTAAENYL